MFRVLYALIHHQWTAGSGLEYKFWFSDSRISSVPAAAQVLLVWNQGVGYLYIAISAGLETIFKKQKVKWNFASDVLLTSLTKEIVYCNAKEIFFEQHTQYKKQEKNWKPVSVSFVLVEDLALDVKMLFDDQIETFCKLMPCYYFYTTLDFLVL